VVDLELLKRALVAEDFNIDDERFVRAVRHAQNPAGCKYCGARTMMAVEDPKKKNTFKLACCGRKVG
jgi:hypothetical protein